MTRLAQRDDGDAQTGNSQSELPTPIQRSTASWSDGSASPVLSPVWWTDERPRPAARSRRRKSSPSPRRKADRTGSLEPRPLGLGRLRCRPVRCPLLRSPYSAASRCPTSDNVSYVRFQRRFSRRFQSVDLAMGGAAGTRCRLGVVSPAGAISAESPGAGNPHAGKYEELTSSRPRGGSGASHSLTHLNGSSTATAPDASWQRPAG